MLTKGLIKNVGFQVVVAMVLGALVGAFMGEQATVFAPLGTLFIQLIKMLVIPLVAVAILSGAANLGASPAAGKIGVTTLAFFLGTSALAVLLALVMGQIFKPGIGVEFGSMASMFSGDYSDKGALPDAVATLLGMIPTNVFQSLNEANILQILVFCMFLGIALAKQPRERAKPLVDGLNTLVDAFVWMINKVMLIAPLGVFGLMADAIGTYGFDVLTLVIKLFVVYPLLVMIFSNTPVRKYLSAMKKPQIVAFSTASSMATLPVNMETCEKELKVSNATASFVLPLGATINMSGNAIYYGLVAIFFAQVYQIDLSMGAWAAIIVTATLGAIGQAGVPGPSFLVVAVLLAAGIPIEGLPLLFALDRLFDMIRTALNITGDAACAVIVDRYSPDYDPDRWNK